MSSISDTFRMMTDSLGEGDGIVNLCLAESDRRGGAGLISSYPRSPGTRMVAGRCAQTDELLARRSVQTREAMR